MKFKFCVMLLMVSACSQAPETRSCADANVDFSKLFKEQYVDPFRNGDAEQWVQVFANDAVALHNRRPVDVGAEAIGAFGQVVADTFEFAEYEPRIVETRTGCGWAMSRGEYRSSLIFKESGEPAPWGPEEGKFLIIWEQQENGEWKIVADMGNSNG